MTKHNFQKFIFSNHALMRCKERIKDINKNDSDLIIQSKLRGLLIKIEFHEFEDKNHYYFKVPNQYGMYVVVKKSNYLVITVTKISDAKKITLLSK